VCKGPNNRSSVAVSSAFLLLIERFIWQIKIESSDFVLTMKFRIRKRKEISSHDHRQSQTLHNEEKHPPPAIITVPTTSTSRPEDDINNERWAIQKVFASQLMKLSRKHLTDNRHVSRRRKSLADMSTSGDSSCARPHDQIPTSESPNNHQEKEVSGICGVTNDNSLLDSKRASNQPREDASEKNSAGRSAVPCIRHRQMEDSSIAMPIFGSPCFLKGYINWCPLLSLFPHSFHDVEGNDLQSIDDNKGSWYEAPFAFANRLVKTRPFCKSKPNTKRNGIPRVITVVIDSKAVGNRDGPCCGAFSGCMKEGGDLADLSDLRLENDIVKSDTFDTSLARLEESLMRANLDADKEEKFDPPVMHHGNVWKLSEILMADQHHRHHQDRTAEGSSVTSSISTHSSLNFQADIITKLPETLVGPDDK
jgi:hypothetical protein